MRLNDFPRPADDNGIGIHFGLDLRPAALETNVARMSELRVKWCLVPHSDPAGLARAASAISAAGILPISRWICHIDQNSIDWIPFVRVLDQLGLPAYVQIFNEPSDVREWRDGVIKPRAFVGRWCDHATKVAEAGGFPGLQVVELGDVSAVLDELSQRNATRVIEQMWFCPHPYGGNHPPDYPYDSRNQLDHPGATLADDNATVLQFLEFAPVFQQALGFVPPFIAAEGGWPFDCADDPRYGPVNDVTHAVYHAALFDWFRTGLLTDGEPLPDFLFAFCPWILFGAEPDAWYSTTTGMRTRTIEGIKAMPAFVRQFSNREPVLAHYALFGNPSAGDERWVRIAADYLARFGSPFGFSVQEALNARRVTIIGDQTQVSWEDEVRLKAAGCRVERLIGGEQALEIILKDRINRESEY